MDSFTGCDECIGSGTLRGSWTSSLGQYGCLGMIGSTPAGGLSALQGEAGEGVYGSTGKVVSGPLLGSNRLTGIAWLDVYPPFMSLTLPSSLSP